MLAQAEMAYNSMRHYDERLTGKALKKKEAEFAEWVEVRDILKPYQSDLRDLSNDLKDIKYSKKSRKQKLHEKDRLLKERNKVFMDAVTEARDYLKGIK
jgi:transposase